jgi:multiple sugar transport system substrate-binding protein
MLKYNSDFWHDPAYAEMLAVMQEGFTGYASGQVADPLHALKYVACKQQQILYDEGTAKTGPSGACSGIRLL